MENRKRKEMLLRCEVIYTQVNRKVSHFILGEEGKVGNRSAFTAAAVLNGIYGGYRNERKTCSYCVGDDNPIRAFITGSGPLCVRA